MNKRANSLQAALSGAAVADEPVPATPKAAPKKRPPVKQSRAATKKTSKPTEKKASNAGRYRDSTVMVGGHFPPHVLRQLRMIAAEEDTTNQALIAEALDLLFTRKGKSKISDLATGQGA